MRKLRRKLRQSPHDLAGTCGLELATWRRSRGMSQAELAAALGLSVSTVQGYERRLIDNVPLAIHWALKGLDGQTRPWRHYVIHLDGAARPHTPESLYPLHLAELLRDPDAGIILSRELNITTSSLSPTPSL